MTLSTLEIFLKENDVKYETVKHSPTYTAQETAQAAHISGKDLLKSIAIKVDGKPALMIEPANQQLDLKQLKASLHANNVELAREYEFKNWFPDDCEVGAMPPLGSLFGLPVYAAKSLIDEKTIAFNAGSHEELIKMNWQDFLRLEKPEMVEA